MAVMERPRWTDERIEERFDRVDTDIRGLRTEMKEGFAQIDKRFDQFEKRFEQVDKRFEQIDKRFERVDDRFVSMQSEMNLRFEAVQRNMTLWFVSLFSTIIAATIAFH